MKINKWMLWGGGGLAAVAAVYLVMKNSGAASGSSTDGSFYPPITYSGGTAGGTTSTDPGTGTTDDSIAQLIAGNLAIAQAQSSATEYTSDNSKTVALATLAEQQTVALDTNATGIKQSLASQLGNVIQAFTKSTVKTSSSGGFFGIGAGSSSEVDTQGPGSIVGSLGFDPNGQLKINLAQGPASTAPSTAKAA